MTGRWNPEVNPLPQKNPKRLQPILPQTNLLRAGVTTQTEITILVFYDTFDKQENTHTNTQAQTMRFDTERVQREREKSNALVGVMSLSGHKVFHTRG